MARGLAARGDSRLSSAVACPPGSVLAARATAAGLPVLALPAGGPFSPSTVSRLARLVREHRPRLLHAHTSHTHTLALLGATGTPARVVVTRRVDFPVGRGPVGRAKYRRVTRLAAVSAGVKGVLQAGGAPAEKVDVILDGIDFPPLDAATPADRQSFRAELGLAGEDLAVGITAHFADHKDHRTLLLAFREVERAVPRARLLLVGRGELEEELRALVARLRLRRVTFTGWREDIPRVLSGLDVFVSSSHLEGLGSSVMDAMYRALPVVATRAGGVPELIRDGVDGLLVPRKDPPALAAALCRVLGDPDLRRRLGSAARAVACRRFSAERMVEEYAAFYARALGEGE